MKILLTGAGGLLGRDCLVVFQENHEVVAMSRMDLDIAEPGQVDAALSRCRPDAVVNCAAFTQVDRCETAREEAVRANVAGPRNLALAAARHGALLLHLSSDYVFDGLKPPPAPYLEDDPTGPLSWYGRTKLDGEEAIQSAGHRHIIVRTAWLYGRHGPNFLKKILSLALSPQIPELKVVDDQYGCPTWSYHLARQLARLLEAGGQGVYHAVAEGCCTWFELARAFLERMGIDKPIRPCPTSDYPTPAARPRNSILANGRLKEAGLNLMRPWREDLGEFVGAFGEDLRREAQGM
jgi:dTDP-4-dehydrorhamnose reductase